MGITADIINKINNEVKLTDEEYKLAHAPLPAVPVTSNFNDHVDTSVPSWIVRVVSDGRTTTWNM